MVEYRSRESRENKNTSHTEWTPRTELGRKVASGEITTLEQVITTGKKILEPQIIDALVPDLKEEVLSVSSTQRMTACGRKMMMRAVVVLGNYHGVIAVGVGKAPETRDAIAEAIRDAKKHVSIVKLGCGSWECGCGTEHTVAQQARGKNSSTTIVIKPAPRGVGLAAGETARIVLKLAGVKDAWTFAKGRTRNALNMVLATIKALDSNNHLKRGSADWSDLEKEAALEEKENAKQK